MELDLFRGGHVENNTGVDPLLRRPTAGGMAGTVFDGANCRSNAARNSVFPYKSYN